MKTNSRRFQSISRFFTRLGNSLVEFLISPPLIMYRGWNGLFLGLLFGAGLFQWLKFLSWGKGPFTFHDWSEITAPRLAFLQDAVTQGVLPLHTASTEALGNITTRFLAVPDMILSPQIFLLRYLELGAFVLLQVSLMYTLGFWGLIQFRKRFQLSLLAFTILFCLYHFNGHILAHISVGHLTWGGYFLLIWFVMLVFDLLDGKKSWRWVTQVACLLLAILLQGAYHQFVWCLLFLGFLGIFSIQNFIPIIKAAIFTVLASLARLLPPFILLGQFNNQFMGGYRDMLSILLCLFTLQLPRSQTGFEDVSGGLTTWESTLYIGLLGAVFLFYFGFWRAAAPEKASHNYRVVLLPSLGLVFLSLGRIYQSIRELLPLPLFTGERISSRMVSLAFVFILALAVIEFQHWLSKAKHPHLTVMLVILLILLGANDLWQNYIVWSFGSVSGEFPVQGFTPSQWVVANDPGDIPYLRLVWVGAAITVATVVFLLAMTWKEHRTHLQKKITKRRTT
jgi:hypothetical protein